MIEARATPLLTAYLAKRGDLLRFFTARLRSQTAAEDLVQEIYEKVARTSPDEVIENPAAYLYRLGANLMLDNLRYDRRRTARDAAWLETGRLLAGGGEAADEAPADVALESRQRLRRLLEAVKDLPPQSKRAFQLHKLQGLSHAETAKAMGVSKSAVEKHISLALKFLLARLP